MAFMSGIYVHSTMDLKYMIAKSEGFVDANPDVNTHVELPESCPDLLVQRGAKLFLYFSKQPVVDGKNPVIFDSLEEYGKYMKELNDREKKECPILYLQQENNAQGNDVYRIRPSPYNPFAGIPADSALIKPYNGEITKVVDASRENGFNQGLYPGFDPYGQDVGRITNVDLVHQSTETSAVISDNPMDSNWGGVLFTQGQVETGKYDENIITRPNFPLTKN
jgi:hypothetical protein